MWKGPMFSKIYLDMDGVLVDFDRGVYDKFKKLKPEGHRTWEYNYEQDFGCSKQQFWQALDHTFWADLKFTKEAVGILEILYSRGLEDKVCLLSSPTLEPGSWSGKVEWVKRNLPHFFYDKKLILTHNKLWNVAADAVLIDDKYETCASWAEAGGHAFCFPRPWNPLGEFEGKAVQLLEEHLDYLGVGERGKL